MCQVERIVLALLPQDQVPGLTTIDFHVAHGRLAVEPTAKRIEVGQQRRAALKVLDAQASRQAQVGQVKVRLPATAVVPPGTRLFPRCAGRIVGLIVGEAIGTRTATVGRAAGGR